jgi:malate dehydrogenase (oxaloacetate-decarboxylating)
MVSDGLDEDQARSRVYVLDAQGLLVVGRPGLDSAQRRLAQPAGRVRSSGPGIPSLLDVVDAVHPTALIGLSTAAGAFTETVIRRMTEHTERPIIMPLSNPTSRSEARPQDLADWTSGAALIATGSPFEPVRIGRRVQEIAQCNNVYVFSGLGLGVATARATRVTDAMLTAAATAVGADAPVRLDRDGALLPAQTQLVDVATAVARAVALAAVTDGVAPESDACDDRRSDR